jgi:uncharacterized protein YqiB (DUF1249 family)
MARARYSIDLRAHMAECDANYARMHRLLPELFDADERLVTLPLPGDDDGTIVFRVVERCPYTTTLSVRFDDPAFGEEADDDGWHHMVPAPELRVRLYHDAQTAEVTGYQGEDRFAGRYEYPNEKMRQPDEKVQLNRFLGEYLALCLAHGREGEPVAVAGR